MKIKNLILGIASFLVAIGGAFTALSAASPDYISLRYADGTDFECTPADTCVGSTTACKVTVDVEAVPGTIIPTLVRVHDFDTNPTACTTELMTSQAVTKVTKTRRIVATQD